MATGGRGAGGMGSDGRGTSFWGEACALEQAAVAATQLCGHTESPWNGWTARHVNSIAMKWLFRETSALGVTPRRFCRRQALRGPGKGRVRLLERKQPRLRQEGTSRASS